ncbi:MAG TPA: methyltransferase regulatory domain-containing protein [Pirellulales bacterium]|nr:methyltransferase regulatory domain-containing protein [Pirellulales bacterium]
MIDNPRKTSVATLKMSLGGRPIEAQIEVPEGPTTPRELLPILQWFTDEAVEAARGQAAQEGKTISCRAGCGACCRQLVPLSLAEAHHVAALIEELPEPRRDEIRRRFQEAERRLAAAGLLERLTGRVPTNDAALPLALEYFGLGIACPFLEDESCSIHPDRPLACREYLVTSPAENCRRPTAETIKKVRLPAWVSRVLLAQERGDSTEPLSWVPLTLAPRWAGDHPEPEPVRTGPELMGEMLRRLTGRELPPADESESTPCMPLPASSNSGSPPGDRAPAAGGQSAAEAYDEVPYHSHSYAFTHPSTMATVATLHGMTPPAVERCRVLELGCASGGNLIPMAFGLPESRFVGLDVSRRQVGDGCRYIERLGLKNVELRVMDLMEVDRSFGEFDYIVCHGVFSWVPRPVQDKILSICAENLAPQGVAMVSYNTYPFWRLRGMVREMVLYHVDATSSTRERVRQGRQFLDFLAENCVTPNAAYGRVLKEEAERWRSYIDDYLRHDQLGEINEPFYFHEFAARVSGHHLQYLGDARMWDRSTTLSTHVRQQLRAYRNDVVRYEQHLDFLCEGGFRRSLLCHEQVRLDRASRPDLLDRMWLTAGAMPAAEQPSADKASAIQFRNRDGAEFSTNVPWLQAALSVLAESWPRQFTFDELCHEARRMMGDAPEARLDPRTDPALLKLPLLECGLKQVVELHVHRWPDGTPRSDRPRATPVARLQAEISCVVTSPRHQSIELSELERQLLLRLDGRHSQAELTQSISALIESGEFAVTPGEGEEVAADAPDVASAIDQALQKFAALGWLDG